MSHLPVLGFPLSLGGTEAIVILVIALLLFGRRQPEVMRSLGKGVVEFKRGVRDIEDEVDRESSSPSSSRIDQRDDSSTKNPNSANN